MTLLHTWIKRIAIGLIVLMGLGAVVQIVLLVCLVVHAHRYTELFLAVDDPQLVGSSLVISTLLLITSIYGLIMVIREDRKAIRGYWMCGVWLLGFMLLVELANSVLFSENSVEATSSNVRYRWFSVYTTQSLGMRQNQTNHSVPTRLALQPPTTLYPAGKPQIPKDTEPTVPDGWPPTSLYPAGKPKIPKDTEATVPDGWPDQARWIATTEPPPKLPTSEFFDGMHSELECCGFRGKEDFKVEFEEQLPATCCPGSPSKCLEADAYPRGCTEPIEAIMRSYYLGMTSMHGILSVLMIAAGIFSCVLLRVPPDDDDDD